MRNTPNKRASPLRTSSQASARQRRADAKTSTERSSERSSEPYSELSSEPSSSEPSHGVFHRLSRGFVLPSASSQVNIQHLTKKLAAGSFARRNTSIAAYKHVDRTVPTRTKPVLSSEKRELQENSNPLSAGFEPARDTRKHITPQNIVDDWDQTFGSRALASNLPSQSGRRAEISSPNEKRQNGGISRGLDVERVYADEETEDSVPYLEASDTRQITEQWRTVNQRRDVMHETFRRLGKERTRLLDVRKDRNGAYQKLKLEIQKVLPNNPEIFQIFQQLDHLELSYQSAEISVDDLIDEVLEGEVELELEERRFFTNLVESTSSSGTLSRASSRDTLRGIEGNRVLDRHPLLETLQATSQEVKLAKESLGDMNKRQQLLLLKYPHERTREEEEFLRDVGDLKLQTEEAIQFLSASVTRLQKECRDQNLIPEDENTQNGLFGLQDLSEDIYLDEPMYPGGTSRTDLTHPRFGVLLTNPSHLLRNPPETAQNFLRTALSFPKSLPRRQDVIERAKKEFGIESLLQASESEDKVRYINRWLLHKLRLSPMEAELLLVQFVAVLKLQDPENWQHDVLFYWSRDSAATNPEVPAKEAVDDDLSDESSFVDPRDIHEMSSDSPFNSNYTH